MSKPIDLIRRELHAFCELGLKRGWRLVPGIGYSSRGREFCPLGMARAVVGHHEAPYQLLDGGVEAPYAFGRGFDGQPPVSGELANLYALGLEFRRHYVDGAK